MFLRFINILTLVASSLLLASLQFATIEELKAGVESVRIVGLEPNAVVHWRIGEPSGRQVVMEIVGGKAHFYENTVGVLTNAPGFEWLLTEPLWAEFPEFVEALK